MNKSGKSILLTLTLFAGLLSSCNAKSNKTKTKEGMTTETPAAAAPANEWKKTPGIYAEIVTAKGSIVLSLDYQRVPVTVANFVGLAEGKIKNTAKAEGTPYYDGLTFHRCIHTPQPFMIQGGDPQGTGGGGPGYSFADEFLYGVKFDKVGLLAMANAGPATNGSQFFITEAATNWLDYKHTIFGEVVEGYNLVPQMNNGDVMTKVNIIRVGKEAEAFDAVAIWAKKDELLKENAAAFAAAQAEENKKFTVSAEEVVKKSYPTAKKTASGLYYIIDKEGTGAQATVGKTVSVHYTGTFPTGQKFDSSREKGQPITFQLGAHTVIQGWEEGIAMMKVGGKMRLIIPSTLGWGANGFPGFIPPNATTIFETELVEVK